MRITTIVKPYIDIKVKHALEFRIMALDAKRNGDPATAKVHYRCARSLMNRAQLCRIYRDSGLPDAIKIARISSL